MPLFLIEHSHTAETCFVQNLDMVRQLRGHVAADNAERLGIQIRGDWVSEPEHTVVFIVETDSEEKAAAFATPFSHFGQVRIREGLTCEQTARACLGE